MSHAFAKYLGFLNKIKLIKCHGCKISINYWKNFKLKGFSLGHNKPN